MKLTLHVTYAIDDAQAGKLDAALLHACIAIDATAKRLYPSEHRVGRRFVDCIRNYYWIVEPMCGAGVNLVESRFKKIKLKNNVAPDFAEFIYEIFRCSHAHGNEVPSEYSLVPSTGTKVSMWGIGYGELHMPDRILWALIAVAVFATVNAIEQSTGTYYLSLGDEHFTVSEWWGREYDFREVAGRYNQTRVKFDNLDRLEKHSGGPIPPEKIQQIVIVQPYALKGEHV